MMTGSGLLLEYALPAGLGVAGWGTSMLSVYLVGRQADATAAFGVLLMISVPCYALWGAAKEIRKQEEIKSTEQGWQELKQITEPTRYMAATNGPRTQFVYVGMPPLEAGQMREVCEKILETGKITPASLADVLSNNKARKLQTDLIDLNLAKWKEPSHKQGAVLNLRGWEAVRDVAKGRARQLATSPTEAGD